MKSQVGDK